jgi:hypothetical protein
VKNSQELSLQVFDPRVEDGSNQFSQLGERASLFLGAAIRTVARVQIELCEGKALSWRCLFGHL